MIDPPSQSLMRHVAYSHTSLREAVHERLMVMMMVWHAPCAAASILIGKLPCDHDARIATVQGRHDAEAALREAQEEMAAQAESVRHLQQQLAAAEDSPIAGHLTSSPAG